MEAHHTPGPWKANARLTIEDANGEFIADAAQIEFGESGEYSLDTAEPNARLIAAAPCLLEACRDWMDYLSADEPGDGAHEERLLDAMRAAIAKAVQP